MKTISYEEKLNFRYRNILSNYSVMYISYAQPHLDINIGPLYALNATDECTSSPSSVLLCNLRLYFLLKSWDEKLRFYICTVVKNIFLLDLDHCKCRETEYNFINVKWLLPSIWYITNWVQIAIGFGSEGKYYRKLYIDFTIMRHRSRHVYKISPI